MRSLQDLTGKRFGRLTAIRFLEKRGSARFWLCVCECGKETSASVTNLNSGGVQSCGCLLAEVAKEKLREVRARHPKADKPTKQSAWKVKVEKPKGSPIKHLPVDHTGKVFGNLTALRLDPERIRHWICGCSCGRVKSVATTHLTSGHTRSCGCLSPRPRKRNPSAPSYNPLYNRWWSMCRRCKDPKEIGWARYGGRGIRVCERWQVFENFAADMGMPPTLAHQIDRVNNDGNYEPGNCVWSDASTQGRNRSSTRFVEIEGETLAASAWAERYGIKLALFLKRLSAGWDPKTALATPSGVKPTS